MQEGAVAAFGIFDVIALVFLDEPGMVAGEGKLVEVEVIFGGTANGKRILGQFRIERLFVSYFNSQYQA
jgi:hypothetical protein